MTGVKLLLLHSIILSTKFVYKSYVLNIYMYKEDLALNNLQRLICHKTQQNKTKF